MTLKTKTKKLLATAMMPVFLLFSTAAITAMPTVEAQALSFKSIKKGVKKTGKKVKRGTKKVLKKTYRGIRDIQIIRGG